MQLRHKRTRDVITVFGVVADSYASRPQWEPVDPDPAPDQGQDADADDQGHLDPAETEQDPDHSQEREV